ncbi:MAG: hypothetical protein ACFFFK_12240 [Candidatus Thorarchaeota archaeon]
MSDTPMEVIQQVVTSPNFLMIVIGAILWIIAPFIWVIGFLFSIAGFGLTTVATFQAAMTRPVTSALPGFLFGGLLRVIGYLLIFVPILGIFLAPLVNVSGNVLILFYGASLALQRIDIPIVKDLEDFIESRKKKESVKKEEKVVDVEEDEAEESDTSEE